MKNKGTRTLLFAFIIAIIVNFMLFGCGTRKVAKSTEIEKSEVKAVDSTKTVESEKTNTVTFNSVVIRYGIRV